MRTRKKDAWRDYLRGKYLIKNPSFENKMRYEIRERAQLFMSDLLLIAQKADEKDKILIFRNPKIRKKLILPLIQELVNTSQYNDEKLEEVMRLGEFLEEKGIRYSVPLLVRSTSYRQKKHIELLCKEGFPRKYAKAIATGEAQKTYPRAI